MADDNFTLTTFYASWKEYQDRIKEAIAPLTAEQLDLRAAPGLRSIGENARHIIGCRVGWFVHTLGEKGGAEITAIAGSDGEAHLASRTAAELAQDLESSWQFMADCVASWSPADMEQTFPDDWEGEIVQLSRAWVVWHVLEHDLHHGGEVSLTFGIYGIKANFPG